jgi:hypothetical protein
MMIVAVTVQVGHSRSPDIEVPAQSTEGNHGGSWPIYGRSYE